MPLPSLSRTRRRPATAARCTLAIAMLALGRPAAAAPDDEAPAADDGPSKPARGWHRRAPRAVEGSGLASRHRTVALGLGAVGLASLGIGLALGVSARGLEDQAYAACPDPTVACADAAHATALLDRGHDRAVLANVGYGLGVAGLLGAAVLWWVSDPEEPAGGLALAPRLGEINGVDVLVRF